VLMVMNAATARTVAKMNAGVPSLRAMSSPSRVKCHGPLLERKAEEGCDANHTLVDRRKQLLLSGAGFERPPLLKDSLVEGISVRGVDNRTRAPPVAFQKAEKLSLTVPEPPHGYARRARPRWRHSPRAGGGSKKSPGACRGFSPLTKEKA
jgi:hypothetical protein